MNHKRRMPDKRKKSLNQFFQYCIIMLFMVLLLKTENVLGCNVREVDLWIGMTEAGALTHNTADVYKSPGYEFGWHIEWEADEPDSEDFVGELFIDQRTIVDFEVDAEDRSYSGTAFIPSNMTPGSKSVRVRLWRDNGEEDNSVETQVANLHIITLPIVNPTGDPTDSEEAEEGVNEFTFDDSEDGYCYIKCEVGLDPAYTEWAEDNVVWYIDPEIESSDIKWGDYRQGTFTEADNKGTTVWIQFSGLPASNSEFGPHTILMGVTGIDIWESDIEIFYLKTETNHPSDESNSYWPNWMYYWMQTVTPLGDPAPTFSHGTYNFYSWEYNVISLSDDCALEYNEPYATNNPLKGIDLFAWRVRHESQHYVDATAFWDHDLEDYLTYHLGFFGADDDYDGDYLPNQFEDENLNQAFNVGELYDWADDNTYETPGIVDDSEDWDCRRNKDVVGNHALDWANPGMQHDQNDEYDN